MKFLDYSHLGKRVIFTLISLLCLAYLMRQLSWTQNPFITGRTLDLTILWINFTWLLYYFSAEFLILPVMQELLLKVNPMVYVRRPSRNRLFLEALGTLLALILLFTILLAILIFSFSLGKSDPISILKILLPAAFSLLTFSLFLLAISLASRDSSFAWVCGLIWAIIALLAQSNYMLLITKITDFPFVFEAISCALLLILVFYLNKQTELR